MSTINVGRTHFHGTITGVLTYDGCAETVAHGAVLSDVRERTARVYRTRIARMDGVEALFHAAALAAFEAENGSVQAEVSAALWCIAANHRRGALPLEQAQYAFDVWMRALTLNQSQHTHDVWGRAL